MMTAMLSVKAHWAAIAYGLGVWAMIATVLNRVRALMPAPTAPTWQRALHTAFIDWPAFLPKVDFRGLFGLPVNVPYLTVSHAIAEAPPASNSQRGSVRLGVIMAIAAAGLAAVFFAGCGDAYTNAVKTKGILSLTLNTTFQTWVKYDQQKEVDIARASPSAAAYQARIASYTNGEQTTVRKLIDTAWQAMVALDAAITAYKLGKGGDLNGAIQAATDAVYALGKAVATLIAQPVAALLNSPLVAMWRTAHGGGAL